MNARELRKVWAKGELLPEKPFGRPLLIASIKGSATSGAGLSVDLTLTGSIGRVPGPVALR